MIKVILVAKKAFDAYLINSAPLLVVVKNLEPSSTLKINETSRLLEEKGKTIFKFGFGQSPFQVPADIVDELKNNAHQNKYLPMQGLVDLRRSVAKYTSDKKNFNYTFEDVVIGPGSKELMFLLHIIFDGEIILPIPFSIAEWT